MRIDLDELARILEKEHVKSDVERGMQPELVLGCFRGQRFLGIPVNDTEVYCNPTEDSCYRRKMTPCPHWESCSKYLHFAQILINPFTGARIKE